MTLSLPEMGLYGAVMIGVILVIRVLGHRVLPRRTFPILWGLAVFRLLTPFTLPFSLPLGLPRTAAVLPGGGDLALSPAALPAAVQLGEQAAAVSFPPLWTGRTPGA